jgi:outer membrane scaffolding protein for murein synthesis (MipA/OmpV family)
MKSLSFVAALVLTGAAATAHAAGGLILLGAPPKENYTLSVGATLDGYPEAPGSNHTKLLPLPGIDFYSSLGGFVSTDIGVGWNFSKREDLQFGVRLWPILARNDDQSQQRGLQPIGNRLGKALYLNYAPWPFLILQSNLLAGSAYHGDGVQAEAGATLGTRLGDSTLVGLTLGGTWANGPHMRSYFGVTPQESAGGGLPVYTPGAGWLDGNIEVNAETRFDEHWKLSGQIIQARLVGDAGSSPVTLSRNQTTFSLTIWYQFK